MNNTESKDVENYLDMTNENDYADYPKLSSMSAFDREERIKELWLKAYLKAKGAAVILSTFKGLRAKIQLFGRQLLINSKKKDDEIVVIKKTCPFIIMPRDKFKIFWNIVIIILLVYTASYMPY